MNVYDLPIYKEHYEKILEIIRELDSLLLNSTNKTHRKLIENAYAHAVDIFPNLNAGYNYWNLKIKLQLYNKVRMILSELQVELSILYDLKLIKENYSKAFEESIKYVGSLIRKLESPVENGKQE